MKRLYQWDGGCRQTCMGDVPPRSLCVRPGSLAHRSACRIWSPHLAGANVTLPDGVRAGEPVGGLSRCSAQSVTVAAFAVSKRSTATATPEQSVKEAPKICALCCRHGDGSGNGPSPSPAPSCSSSPRGPPAGPTPPVRPTSRAAPRGATEAAVSAGLDGWTRAEPLGSGSGCGADGRRGSCSGGLSPCASPDRAPVAEGPPPRACPTRVAAPGSCCRRQVAARGLAPARRWLECGGGCVRSRGGLYFRGGAADLCLVCCPMDPVDENIVVA